MQFCCQQFFPKFKIPEVGKKEETGRKKAKSFLCKSDVKERVATKKSRTENVQFCCQQFFPTLRNWLPVSIIRTDKLRIILCTCQM